MAKHNPKKGGSPTNAQMTRAIHTGADQILSKAIQGGEDPAEGCVVGIDCSTSAGRDFVRSAAIDSGMDIELLDRLMAAKPPGAVGAHPIHLNWYRIEDLCSRLPTSHGLDEEKLRAKLLPGPAMGHVRLAAVTDTGVRIWDEEFEGRGEN